MADLVPAMPSSGALSAAGGPQSRRSGAILSPLTDPSGGSALSRLRSFTAQPAVKRSLPAIAGVGALAMAAGLWFALSQPPQRVLYGSLSDSERASVVAALDTAGIAYTIDNNSGALTVGEDDVYRARMLVASDGALAAPESASEMLDAIPLGASRTLEGERVRNVRERELMLTIMEIDGVEAVRVHLATPERSVFVREQAAPTASVMVRLARGRSLTNDQVVAIGNLVAASVPGMSADAVRIVDQHGKLLSAGSTGAGDGLELQRQFEDKLRAQVAQLLVPIVGEGNFSSEVQVELEMAETTSAQESYDKDGALRTETQSQSQQMGAGAAPGGIPGVLANTPPPETQIEEAAPEGTAVEPAGTTTGESSARRTYELGRQVSVSSTTPGGVRRVSVAVALSAKALEKLKPASVTQIEELVSAAVGANVERGDTVKVIASNFEPASAEALPFYETGWFAMILRHSVALIAVILALVFGVRPLVRALKGKREENAGEEDEAPALADGTAENPALLVGKGADVDPLAHTTLREQIELTRKLAAERPEHAAETLRRMLAAPVATAS